MDIREQILRNLPLDDPEDMDVLLDIAGLVRGAVGEKNCGCINSLIRYTVAHSYYEAFYWILGILEETYERQDDTLTDFECLIGKIIPDYREFVARLQVDLSASGNEVVPVRDEHGEIQSFFNIISYKTGFDHIDLVSVENFDAKDQDYIQYKLVFSN